MCQSYNIPCSGICRSLKNGVEVTRSWKMEVVGLLENWPYGENEFKNAYVLIEENIPLKYLLQYIYLYLSLSTTKIYSGYPNWLWSWQKYKARGSTFSKSYVPLSSHCRGNSKISFFGEGVVRWTKKLKTIYWSMIFIDIGSE